MSTNRYSEDGDLTLAYYEHHAARYTRETLNVDMSPLYQPFLDSMSEGGRILDAGCGSGRDSRAFGVRGYDVTAMDGSPAMVANAVKATGVNVRHLKFEDIAYDSEFDGVWACASLLHVPKSRIDGVLRRLSRALKCGGVIYMSFKQGDREAVRDGRLFNGYSETSLRDLLVQHPGLEITRIWETTDRRQDREGETWINVIARKMSLSEGMTTPGLGSDHQP